MAKLGSETIPEARPIPQPVKATAQNSQRYISTKYFAIPRLSNMEFDSMATKEKKKPFCTKRVIIASVLTALVAITLIVLFAVPGMLANVIEPEVVSSESSASNLNVQIVGSGQGQVLQINGDLTIKIRNPNFFPLELRDTEIYIIRGSIVIIATAPPEINLPGQTETEITLTLSTSFSTALHLIAAAEIAADCLLNPSTEFAVSGSTTGKYTFFERVTPLTEDKVEFPC